MHVVQALVGLGFIAMGMMLFMVAVTRLKQHMGLRAAPVPARPSVPTVLPDQTEEWARYLPPLKPREYAEISDQPADAGSIQPGG